MKNAPCMGCPDRNTMCHSSCEKYLNWKKELTRIKENKQEYYRSTLKHPVYF